MKIGDRLKELRKKAGLSQGDVAKYANITRQYVSELERNRTSPSINTLNKIAEFFRVDPSLFLAHKTDYWYQTLPYELKEFVKKENMDYLKIGLKVKKANISPDTINQIIDLIKKEK